MEAEFTMTHVSSPEPKGCVLSQVLLHEGRSLALGSQSMIINELFLSHVQKLRVPADERTWDVQYW